MLMIFYSLIRIITLFNLVQLLFQSCIIIHVVAFPFSDKKDLSPSEEWGVDQQLISKLKEQYKKERKSKKAHQRMSLVSSSSQGDHMMPIYSTYLTSLCIAWKTSANCIFYLSFAFANGQGYILISSLQHRVLARISKMPIRNSKLKISARPDSATNLLQILIPTTSNSLLCQKVQFTLQLCLRIWFLREIFGWYIP